MHRCRRAVQRVDRSAHVQDLQAYYGGNSRRFRQRTAVSTETQLLSLGQQTSKCISSKLLPLAKRREFAPVICLQVLHMRGSIDALNCTTTPVHAVGVQSDKRY